MVRWEDASQALLAMVTRGVQANVVSHNTVLHATSWQLSLVWLKYLSYQVSPDLVPQHHSETEMLSFSVFREESEWKNIVRYKRPAHTCTQSIGIDQWMIDAQTKHPTQATSV